MFCFSISLRNKCFYKQAQVRVKFEVSGNQDFRESASIFNKKVTIYLDPREADEQTVDPEFKRDNPDLDGFVDVTWKVSVEGSDGHFDGNTARIKVLPRKIFPWNWI